MPNVLLDKLQHKTGIVAFGCGGTSCLLTYAALFGAENTWMITSDFRSIQHRVANGYSGNALDIRINNWGLDGGEERAKSSIARYFNDVKSVLLRYDRIILVGGLGGFEANAWLPVLAGLADEWNLNMTVIATLPLDFEGKARRERAEKTRQEIEKTKCRTIFIDANIFSGLKKSLLELFNTVDEYVAFRIREILSMSRDNG